MSRIGKQRIAIPDKTEVVLSGMTLKVKGPHGELSRDFRPAVAISVEGKEIALEPRSNSIENRALWGTYASHISNMVAGVNTPFVKKLQIEGIGYKAEVRGQEIVLSLGFSHPVKLEIPKGLKVAVDKNATITVTGPDKEEVGAFSAKLRAQKKPEPYKGKGIRYENETVRRKQGKKTA